MPASKRESLGEDEVGLDTSSLHAKMNNSLSCVIDYKAL